MFIRFKRWHLGAAAVLPLLLTACKPHQQQKAGGWPTPTVTVNQPVQQEIVGVYKRVFRLPLYLLKNGFKGSVLPVNGNFLGIPSGTCVKAGDDAQNGR